MTSLIDIFEAAGGSVSEDRSSVTFDSAHPLRPFRAEFLVVPTGVSHEEGRTDRVSLSVVLNPDVAIGETTRVGTPIFEYENEANLEVPADQVKIVGGVSDEMVREFKDAHRRSYHSGADRDERIRAAIHAALAVRP